MEIGGRLEGVQPYTIHDSRYARVFYTHDDAPRQILQCQLPEEALDPKAKPGDSITITYLLKTVMAIAKGG